MDNQKSSPQSHNFYFEGSEPELLHNPVVEEFFAGLKHDMRRPAPGQEAIAAALQAIQKVAANTDTEDAVSAETREPTDSTVCASCGGDNANEEKWTQRSYVGFKVVNDGSKQFYDDQDKEQIGNELNNAISHI